MDENKTRRKKKIKSIMQTASEKDPTQSNIIETALITSQPQLQKPIELKKLSTLGLKMQSAESFQSEPSLQDRPASQNYQERLKKKLQPTQNIPPSDPFTAFVQNFDLIEAARIVIAIDFSLSNKNTQWGANESGQKYTDPHIGQSFKGSLIDSPYRKCIKYLSKIAPQLDINPVTLIPFTSECVRLISRDVPSAERLEANGEQVIGRKPGSEVIVDPKNIVKVYDELVKMYERNDKKFAHTGGTSIAPCIYKAMDLISKTKEFTILIILTDGLVMDSARCAQAIVDATVFPLSIVAIGIGNRDFTTFQFFDTQLFERKFDNFHFEGFMYDAEDKYKSLSGNNKMQDERDVQQFQMSVFSEVYDQFQAAKYFNFIDIIKGVFGEDEEESVEKSDSIEQSARKESESVSMEDNWRETVENGVFEEEEAREKRKNYNFQMQ